MSSIISIKALLDSKDVTKGVTNMNKDLGKVGKSTNKVSGAFKGLAVAGGALAVGSFLKGAISEAAEAAKVGKETERVWKGLGKQAQANSAAVDKLSASIGVDDEALQAQANTMVTSNKAFAQNGNAARAVALSHDLAAAGIGNAEGNSKKLAKALSGSSKNMGVLKKLIPGLTDEQLKHAQSLKDQGKEQEAMNFLLAAGEKKVKGSAEAQAPALQKLQVAWGNIVESVGTLLLPIIEKLAAFATTTLVPILQKVIAFLGQNSDVIIPLVAFIGSLVAAIKVWTIVQTILNTVMSLNPLGIIIIAIVAAIAAIVIAYKKFEGFRKVIDTVWAVVKKVFAFIVVAAKVLWEGIKLYVGFVIAFYKALWEAAKFMWEKVSGFFSSIVTAAKSLWTGVSKWGGKVTTFIKDLPGNILEKVGNIKDTLFQKGKDLIQGLLDGAGSMLSTIGEFFLSKVPGPLKGAFKKAFGINSPSKVFAGYGKNMMEGLANGLKSATAIAEKATINVSKDISGAFKPEAQLTLAGAGGYGANSVTYNVTVNSLDTSADVGRRVVTAIKDYERVSGNGWRG